MNSREITIIWTLIITTLTLMPILIWIEWGIYKEKKRRREKYINWKNKL